MPRAQYFQKMGKLDTSAYMLGWGGGSSDAIWMLKPVLHSRNDAGVILPYLVYTMENAIVSSVSHSGGSGDRVVETLTLNYTKIKWDYTEQKTDVGKKGNNGAVWDLAKNVAA